MLIDRRDIFCSNEKKWNIQETQKSSRERGKRGHIQQDELNNGKLMRQDLLVRVKFSKFLKFFKNSKIYEFLIPKTPKCSLKFSKILNILKKFKFLVNIRNFWKLLKILGILKINSQKFLKILKISENS